MRIMLMLAFGLAVVMAVIFGLAWLANAAVVGYLVWHVRATSLSARVVCSDTPNDATPRRPRPNRSGGPTNVGVSKPASTSRQAVRAASRSRPASQVRNLRYGTAAGSRCP